MVTHPIRVFFADDHAFTLEGFEATLGRNPQLTVVGMARSFSEALEQLKSIPAVDVLVSDLGGMGGAPLTFVHHLRRQYPHIAIVIFSSSHDLSPELLKAGVRGYVLKEELSAQLLAAIRAAHAGQQFLSSSVEEYVNRSDPIRQKHSIAPKEVEMLKHLANGLSTEEIAQAMGITRRSVNNYIASVYNKTGCTERVQLVNWYKRIYESPS